jgi:hypothetical protein
MRLLWKIKCLLLFAVSAWLVEAAPVRYYVATNGSDSGGDGSESKPWKTLSVAVSKVKDEGIEIIVRAGTYSGEVSINRKFTKPASIRSEQPYQAKLQHNHAVVQIADARNVELGGFDISRTRPTGRPSPLLMHIARSEAITLRGNLIHDSYDNDLLKINEQAHDVLITENVFHNQYGPAGQHIDVNGCQNIFVVRNIFFNDFAHGGVEGDSAHGFIVLKNSDHLPESRRMQIAGNIFMNFEGSAGSNLILLGEDASPAHEVQEVLIENNLMIGNSEAPMRAPVGLKGARDVIFRNNTVTGNLPARTYAMRINREGANPRSLNLLFSNNVWSDPTGTMSKFADGSSSEWRFLTLKNNAYWNGGKRLPYWGDLKPSDDSEAVTKDPKLPWPSKVILPHWNQRSFWSTASTFRQEFDRLVNEFARPADGSSLLGAGDPVTSSKTDILGKPRSSPSTMGAAERNAAPPPISVFLFPGRLFGSAISTVNRIVLNEPAPASGLTIRLMTDSPIVSVPKEVFIASGESSVGFPAGTQSVEKTTNVKVRVDDGKHQAEAVLTIVPQDVVAIAPSSWSIWAGESEHALMLEGHGAGKIELSSSRPDLVSFSPVKFQENASYARFVLRLKPVRKETPVTLFAAGKQRKSNATVVIRPGQAVTSLTLDRTHALNGAIVKARVTIAEPAVAGREVTLQMRSENSSLVSVPDKVQIPAGQLTTVVPLITKPATGRRTTVGISAFLNGTRRTRWITVGAANSIEKNP